ncbi:hypothetical protein [Thermococcus sp.]|uniref:hypothetical protein n=1 Tax=Thermococcus sp. TaxID=35749 RepID=UPI00260B1F57|nr:hypothetical protein [Thermococcus sp.]
MNNKINEVWILASELGMYSHKGNSYWVIRKYKRGTGYSARDVERLFSGYTNSGKTEKFESFEELVKFLADEHPTRKNYGFSVSPESLLEALEKAPEEKRKFWSEEIAYLKKLLEGEERSRPEVKPTLQISLLEVFS